MRISNARHFVSFYAIKGQNDNYHYTFKVYDKKAAYNMLKKFKGIRAAYYVIKDWSGNILLNQKLNL